MGSATFGDIFFILVVCGIIWGIMTLVNRSRRIRPANVPPVPDRVAGDSLMETVLRECQVIAAVGIFTGADPIGRARRYLLASGYEVYTLNASAISEGDSALSEALEGLPEIPDMVLISLPGEDVSAWARAASAVGARALWMEKGTVSPEGMHIAREAGLSVIMDHSIEEEHRRLFPPG